MTSNCTSCIMPYVLSGEKTKGYIIFTCQNYVFHSPYKKLKPTQKNYLIKTILVNTQLLVWTQFNDRKTNRNKNRYMYRHTE